MLRKNKRLKLLFQDDMEGSGVYINKIPGIRGADGRQVSCGESQRLKPFSGFVPNYSVLCLLVCRVQLVCLDSQ